MEQIADSLIQILAAVLAVLAVPIAGYAVLFVKNLAAKANVQLSEAMEAKVRQAALDGVSIAAEKALNLAKQNIKLPSGQKLDTAIQVVLDKVPGVTREEAAQAVLAVLPHVRATIDAGTAALGNAIRTPEPAQP